MNSLFDMIRMAQGGAGMSNIGQQFGLNGQQTQSAIEALMPAFSMGLQRQMQNPAGMMDMFGKGAQGGFANMFDQGAPKEEAQTAGNDILGNLFGSKDMSRAVAAQASAASGISDTILKAMMPVIASMLMGGFMKSMMGGGAGGLGGLLGGLMGGGQQQAGGSLGDLLGGMLGGAQQNNAQAGAGAGTGGLGDLLGGMLGGGQQANAPAGAGGLGDLLGGMLGGGAQQGGQPNPFDMLGKMMQPGTQAQPQQMDGLQSIFEQFMGKR
jgi:hypothetical protein